MSGGPSGHHPPPARRSLRLRRRAVFHPREIVAEVSNLGQGPILGIVIPLGAGMLNALVTAGLGPLASRAGDDHGPPLPAEAAGCAG
jgi:hypothetical protein